MIKIKGRNILHMKKIRVSPDPDFLTICLWSATAQAPACVCCAAESIPAAFHTKAAISP